MGRGDFVQVDHGDSVDLKSSANFFHLTHNLHDGLHDEISFVKGKETVIVALFDVQNEFGRHLRNRD